MKALICFSGILIVVYLMCFSCKVNHSDWMDKQFTGDLKGLSILMVVWSHLGSSYGIQAIQFLAGAGVSLFLICSGYGLERSYQKNGLYRYWQKRIEKVAIPYWLLLIGGMIYNGTSVDKHFIKQFLFINPTNWYLRYIFVCYLLYWIYKIIADNYHLSEWKQWILIAVLWTVKFVSEAIWPVNRAVPFLESRQLFAVMFGIWLARHRDYVTGKMNDNRIYGLLILIFTTAIGMNCMLHLQDISNCNIVLYNLCSTWTVFPLALMILFIGYRFHKLFDNLFLKQVGKISYEMFLLHGALIFVLNQKIISVFAYFGVLICISILYHMVVQKINSMLFRKM